jgi:hypothetical protein
MESSILFFRSSIASGVSMPEALTEVMPDMDGVTDVYLIIAKPGWPSTAQHSTAQHSTAQERSRVNHA